MEFDVDPRVKARIFRDDYAFSELRIKVTLYTSDRRSVHIAAPLTMVEHQSGVFVEPTFRVDAEVAQSMMDQLWECGIRPAAGVGSAGQMAAVQAHLQDMRKLVFEDKPTINIRET